MNICRNVVVYFLCALLLIYAVESISETKASSLKSTVNDSVITARIKSQFVTDDNTKAASINVETTDSVVKLTGIVDSITEAMTAIKIAQSTSGVKDVNATNLHIKDNAHVKNEKLEDKFITAKIQGVLIREKLMETNPEYENKIIISTKNGNVILSGYAANSDQLEKIINLTKSVPDVKKVISNIIVSDVK